MPEKKNKSAKALKKLRKAASPQRAALFGALGGAAVMWLGGSRLRAGLEQLRAAAARRHEGVPAQ
jgi:hypothetical protein